MLFFADFLTDRYRKLIIQTDAFVRAQGAGEGEYWIGPADRPSDALTVSLAYEEDPYGEHLFRTRTTITFIGQTAGFVSGLKASLRLTSLLFFDRRLLPLSVANEKMLSVDEYAKQLRVSFDKAFQPRVADFSSGSFIAPESGGYTYFGVDTHGEIDRIAHTRDKLSALFQWFAEREVERVGLGGRLAEFFPR